MIPPRQYQPIPSKTVFELDGKAYKEGFTFAIKPKTDMAVGIVPVDWTSNDQKVIISKDNYRTYTFKYYETVGETAVFNFYEDCSFKFQTELGMKIVEDLFSNSMAEVDLIKLGYNSMPPANYTKCLCDMNNLMNGGCKCGGFAFEQHFKEKYKEFKKLLG